MDSREAPLFLVPRRGGTRYVIAPLNERGRHSANPYGFDAPTVVLLGSSRMPRIAENEPIEFCTASDATA